MSVPPPPPLPVPVIQIAGANKKKDYNKTPQELITEFWDRFFAKKPGKVTSIFPRSLYATLLPPATGRGASSARNAAESYEAAARECREKVRRIVRECNRTNEKFTDPDFDIEGDQDDNCLNGLVREDDSSSWGDEGGPAVSPRDLRRSLDTLTASNLLGPGSQVPVDITAMKDYVGGGGGDFFSALFGGGAAGAAAAAAAAGGNPVGKGEELPRRSSSGRGGVKAGEHYSPGSIHRLDWVFESPQFIIDGYAASDIKQGGNGDCWWLAAVATIANRRDLMDKVCVARDEECGVYGFVFQRDGEWISTVVDDNLYLTYEDFDYYGDAYDSTGKRAREYRKRNQTGSDALYFAKCADPNETWLPLLEKAYAKVHGDYESISGGWSGEAVEDMTGGVTTTVATNRVLKKDKLWRELVNAEGGFVFALSALGTGFDWKRAGLALGHAYSILKATEEVDEDGKKVRLVQIRNPWGERSRSGIGEWNGPWSDGSKEWTAYWMNKLNHKFGDDGIFWMSYEDMLQTFMYLHRTRLFDEKWTVIQQWTSVNIAWVTGYLQTKFLIEIKKGGTVVIAMTQLDERYFLGFEGQYTFALHFVLQEKDGKPGDHICRVRPVHDWENRSVSCEVDLEPGLYEVLPKVTATRKSDKKMVEDVVREWAEKNPQKLRQVGMQYDLAHAKGGVTDEDLELARKQEEKKKKEAEKKRKEKEKKQKEKQRKQKEKEKKKKEKREQKEREKKEKAKAAAEEEAAAKAKKDEVKDDGEEKKKDDSADADKKKDDDKANPSAGSSSSSSSSGDTPAESTTSDAKKDEQKKDEQKKEDPVDDKEKKEEDKKEGGDISVKAEQEKPSNESKQDNDDDDDDNDDDDADDADDDDEEDKKDDPTLPEQQPDDDAPPPWNAVCVLGLRVYSRDDGVTITLVKPKNAEEGSSLSVDNVPAGATM